MALACFNRAFQGAQKDEGNQMKRLMALACLTLAPVLLYAQTTQVVGFSVKLNSRTFRRR